MRAFDGHSIQELKNMAVSIPITVAHLDLIPCIAHGTRTEVINSILSVGLRKMGRQRVMFSALPHWGMQIGHGRRSGQGQWSTMVFRKTRVLRGNAQHHLQPLPIVVVGSSGTVSVHADILPTYIG